MMELLLCWEFFKTGLLAVGGGLATLPFLYHMAARYPWFDQAMLADMIAISESTPGPVGVNMATYAGFHAFGVVGSLLATFSLVLPSVIIIILIAKFLGHFNDNFYVQAAFYGLRPAVTALIAVAGFQVLQISVLQWDIFQASHQWADLIDWKGLILFGVLFLLMRKVHWHPIFFIAAAALVGIVFQL